MKKEIPTRRTTHPSLRAYVAKSTFPSPGLLNPQRTRQPPTNHTTPLHEPPTTQNNNNNHARPPPYNPRARRPPRACAPRTLRARKLIQHHQQRKPDPALGRPGREAGPARGLGPGNVGRLRRAVLYRFFEGRGAEWEGGG